MIDRVRVRELAGKKSPRARLIEFLEGLESVVRKIEEVMASTKALQAIATDDFQRLVSIG